MDKSYLHSPDGPYCCRTQLTVHLRLGLLGLQNAVKQKPLRDCKDKTFANICEK